MSKSFSELSGEVGRLNDAVAELQTGLVMDAENLQDQVNGMELEITACGEDIATLLAQHDALGTKLTGRINDLRSSLNVSRVFIVLLMALLFLVHLVQHSGAQ